MGEVMQMSRHAQQRWIERCNGLDQCAEWRSARRAGRKVKARIKRLTPSHSDFVSKTFRGFYYLVSKSRVVFVVAPPRLVVTVFKLNGEQIDG